MIDAGTPTTAVIQLLAVLICIVGIVFWRRWAQIADRNMAAYSAFPITAQAHTMLFYVGFALRGPLSLSPDLLGAWGAGVRLHVMLIMALIPILLIRWRRMNA